jgi:hypothetical protein
MSFLVMEPSEGQGYSSFESRITFHLMKDCYEKLVQDLGETKAEEVLHKAWSRIEQVMLENGVEPLNAATIIFENFNFDKQLHSECYAAIYWKTELDGISEPSE